MLKNSFSETQSLQMLARFDFLDLCLLGETGTGKTHAARLIHEWSPRAGNAFNGINCAELSPSIIEAELFGYEKGAFTGATASKAGKFEAAAGGTLFLDEIGELPANLQAKLLKVVEEKSITRVGGNRQRQIDVRIIYATHRDLSIFREDFRYRIAAHPIYLKPLRERRQEIVALARLFLIEFSRRSGQNIEASDNVLKLLENAEWRGNVRELRSFVEKICLNALLFSESESLCEEIIELTDELLLAGLSSMHRQQANSKTFPLLPGELPLYTPGENMEGYLKEIETHLLKNALESHNNNQTRAARYLGISRGGLIKKLKRLSH